MALILGPPRYPLVPWGDVQETDLRPQGDACFQRDVYHERHLGLFVTGTYGAALGIVAVRCERKGGVITPLTLSIADSAPILVGEALQSNPRRHEEEADDAS